MIKPPHFEQNQYSITSTGIYKMRHDSLRLMKWLAFYDRSYFENKIYYDLIGSVLKSLNEIS